jgi:hypothetical protein
VTNAQELNALLGWSIPFGSYAAGRCHDGCMSETWNKVPASDVKVGDRIRHPRGGEIIVSQIEPAFMGRAEMLAFIEDTPERWFKAPMPTSAEVEVLAAD